MTISEEKFVVLLRGLGGADAPAMPDWRAGITRRAKRIRRRRTIMATLTVLLAVFATAGGAYAVTRRPPLPAVIGSIDGMPTSFTESDGTKYVRLATLTLSTSKRTTASARLPALSTPIAIVVRCPQGIPIGASALFSLTGPPAPNASHVDCPLTSYMPTRAVPDLPTRTEIIELDPKTKPRPGGRPTVTIALESRVPATLVFAIYTWHLPAHPRPPSAPPVLPAIDGHWKLHKEYSGAWPRQTTVTISIPKGVRWGMLNACPDVLTGADSLQTAVVGDLTLPLNGLRMFVNGELTEMAPCSNAASWPSTSVGNEWTAKADTSVRLTMAYAPMYSARTGTWAVGIYYYSR